MKKLLVPSVIAFIISQAVMFYFAVARLSGTGGSQYLSGPAAHFLALFVTSFLIVFILKQIEFKFPYFFAILYCVFAAVIIEFVQQTLPYRTFSVDDMFFGVLGSVTFVVLAKMAQSGHRHLKAKFCKKEDKNEENKTE